MVRGFPLHSSYEFLCFFLFLCLFVLFGGFLFCFVSLHKILLHNDTALLLYEKINTTSIKGLRNTEVCSCFYLCCYKIGTVQFNSLSTGICSRNSDEM